jgi:hypothetical protein
VKLSWRAAASNALSALSGGNRRGIGHLHHEKNYDTLEERGLVRNASAVDLKFLSAARLCVGTSNPKTALEL